MAPCLEHVPYGRDALFGNDDADLDKTPQNTFQCVHVNHLGPCKLNCLAPTRTQPWIMGLQYHIIILHYNIELLGKLQQCQHAWHLGWKQRA